MTEERHHFLIRVPSEHYRWRYQMQAVEPLPYDMAVTAWLETDLDNNDSIVYDGWHGGSPESLAIIHKLMEAARGAHRQTMEPSDDGQ